MSKGNSDKVIVETIHRPPEPYRGIGDLGRVPFVVGALTLVLLIACVLLTPQPTYNTWQPQPEPADPGWMDIVIYVLIGAPALLVVAFIVYLVGRLLASLRLAFAEVKRAHIQASLVQADENGLLPGMVNGDTFVDLNAAPAGRVEGLKRKRPTMPVPESDDHRIAANRAAFIRLAAGAGGLANRALEMLAQQPAGSPDMPPLLNPDDAPAEINLLIDAAERDYKLLMEGDHAS